MSPDVDEQVARAYESVVLALRRLRPELRLRGTTFELGVRRVWVVGGTPGQWSSLLRALDHADLVLAEGQETDDDDDELTERPVTVGGGRRRSRRRRRTRKPKRIIPRESFD